MSSASRKSLVPPYTLKLTAAFIGLDEFSIFRGGVKIKKQKNLVKIPNGGGGIEIPSPKKNPSFTLELFEMQGGSQFSKNV